jgi:hypothetical protein
MIRSASMGFLLVLVLTTEALALCSDVNDDGQVTAVDALSVLKTAVGQPAPLQCSCVSCGTSASSPKALAYCADLNVDGQVSALDALASLKLAVGQPQPFSCSCDACLVSTTTTSTTTTSTTTTTVGGGCPPPDALDDRTYNETYTCSFVPEGGEPICDVTNAQDTLHFTHTGGNDYEVLDVPDTGFVYNGSLDCRTFTWTALSPGDYTEEGTWEFSGNLSGFSGSSSYFALDSSYSGDCNITGAEAPDTPPNPTLVPPCL